MELNELKEIWLSTFPDSSHTNDVKRFIRYALELAKVNGSLKHVYSVYVCALCFCELAVWINTHKNACY